MNLKYHGKPHDTLAEVERIAHSDDIYDKFGFVLQLDRMEVEDLWADVCWEIEQAFQRGVSSNKLNKT